MNAKQIMIKDGAPRALFLTPEARRKAWQGRTLTTIPFIEVRKRDEDETTAAFRIQFEAERRQKSLAGIAKMKNRFAAKAAAKVDYSKMRWDARRNKFVPMEVGTMGNVVDNRSDGRKPDKSPPRTAVAGTPAQREVKGSPQGLADGSHQITKDNAEAIAKLNGVWKDSYEKLRGTGRIVMTVGNVLKGITRKGGVVKWQ